MKRFLMLLCILFLITTTSCGKTSDFERKFNKIKDQEISQIVKILGQANEKFIATPDFDHNTYYWFDKDYDFKEAKLHCKDETIMYIAVVIDIKTKQCIGKAFGQVTPDLKLGDVNVRA